MNIEKAEESSLLAETEWYRQSISTLQSEREKHVAETKLFAVQAWDAERQLKAFKTRTLFFSDAVEEIEVKSAVDRLLDWMLDSPDPISIVLNSPGGDVFHGFLLFDTLETLRENGIYVTTVVRGYAASMAAILSQAGDRRCISRNSWFMIHEPSSIVLGTASHVKTEAKLLEALHKQMCGLLAERSQMTTEQIQKRVEGKDWWMSADEAVSLGFFDSIV